MGRVTTISDDVIVGSQTPGGKRHHEPGLVGTGERQWTGMGRELATCRDPEAVTSHLGGVLGWSHPNDLMSIIG